MKDLQRVALLAGIFAILFLLLLQWKKFDAQNSAPSVATATTTTSSNNTVPSASSTTSNPAADDLPSQDVATPVATKTPGITPAATTLIDIKTDVLNVKINRQGGDIVMINLQTYSADLEYPDVPFELLNQTADKLYIAQSGLIGKNGTDKPGERPLYDTAQNAYALAEGQQTLVVDLTLPEQNGIQITKRFTFRRGEHLFQLSYLINNKSNEPWEAALFGQIKRDASAPVTKSTGMKPFLGGATTTQDDHYKKLNFKQIDKAPLKASNTGGWIAFVQHYFITAWIPDVNDSNNFSMRKLSGEDVYIFGFTSATHSIAAGTQGEINAQFYAGPKLTQRLEQISPYLDLTVDYGWLWWVAKPIHWFLQMTHTVIHNWGWSIIVLTLMIKLMLFPLSHTAYLSMGHMRKVAPKMAALREQCGDNRQKLQEEMLKLYKTEKINPMGGCLPMLLQMPVFISLYWVLQESVEIRQAPFMGWIHDLSVMDPYFVLPIIMGISMFLQQKMNPAPPDPTQAKVMQFLPFVFTFMFLWFPAGLVLYWVVNNLTSMAHQSYINKLVERGSA
jgi:YidC/Oxa1 family membrane protein insertase